MLDRSYILEKNEDRHITQRIFGIAVILSIVIALAVFWGLKLTGITMAGDALCGIEEHSHSAQCLESSLICGLEENKEHTHTEACYGSKLVCEREEHTHTTICYSDTTADIESPSIWKGSFIDVELTDNLRSNLLEIAFSQMGYEESSRNFDVDENGERRGYTRYGDWIGDKYCAWSAAYVSFCLDYAGIDKNKAPVSASPQEMLEKWRDKGYCSDFDDDDPHFGDILFLDLDKDGECDAAAIVSGCAVLEKISAFQGDVDNAVSEVVYDWEDSRILCFGVLQKAINDELIDTNYGISLLATTATAQVYGVNSGSGIWSGPFTRVVYGGSVVEKTGSSTLLGWTAIVIEYDSENGLYVSQIDDSGNNKGSYRATTADGFVLVFYRSDSNSSAIPSGVSVGDYVTVSPTDFYKTDGFSSSAPLGTLTFTNTPNVTYEGTKKPDKDNSGKLQIVDAADTRDLIEVNLYDYGTNINDLWLQDNKYPGFQQNGGNVTMGSSITRFHMNFGDNITSEIAMGPSFVSNNGGDINAVNGGNTPVSGAISNHLINGYPALADGTSLSYLFSDNEYAQKQNKQSINGLFQYDEQTGTYYYNCRKNHAQFNSSDDTFTLYAQTITPNFIMYPFGNFLPFNDIVKETTRTTDIDREHFNTVAQSALYKNSALKLPSQYRTLSTVLSKFVTLMDNEYGTGWDYYTCMAKYFTATGIPVPSDTSYLQDVYNIDYDEESDFFFGMDMHLDFIQPKNGMTGENAAYPMSFDFSGDDDVWIFVDGKLFLDLTGIHRHVGGTIDFKNGEVRYYDFNPETSETDILVDTVEFSELLGSSAGLNANGAFRDYSTHTFDFYYMERGSGSGICQMEFNLPTLQQNAVGVSKSFTSDSDMSKLIGDPDFHFQILKANTEDLLIGPGVEYGIYSLENQKKIGTGITGENGIISVKANQMAVFENVAENAGSYFVREILDENVYKQYDIVTIDGSSTTVDSYTNLTIGESTFKGVESEVENAADGNTFFNFSNNIDINKTSKLEISKTLQDYTFEHVDMDFTFMVELDSKPLPVGTPYTLIHTDSTEESCTVTEAGIIKIRHGEKVVIDNILAGTKFTVKEIGLPQDQYSVIYNGRNVTLSGMTDSDGIPYVTGIIAAESVIGVDVVNDKNGTKLNIPATKTISNPDGSEYNFTLELREIMSAANMEFKPDGVHLHAEVPISSGSVDTLFTINYPSDTSDGKHYYKIFEAVDETYANRVDFDSSYYIAEVTTKLVSGTVQARLTGLWKNGLVEIAESMEFDNRVMRSLSISKEIKGTIQSNEAFRFNITAMDGFTPVNGVFKCTGTAAEEVKFVNGHATVYVRGGETLTILDLPPGMSWTVQEVTPGGYYTTCGASKDELSEGNSLSGVLDSSKTAYFTNISGDVLPKTGSLSWLIYTLGGALLVSAPLMYRCLLKRRRKGGAG